MQISNENARVLISVLKAGVVTAERKGETSFELTNALQAFDDTTRQELVDAIKDAAK